MRQPAPPTKPEKTVFDGASKGFQITLPAGWKPEPSKDFVLLLRPAGEDDGSRLSVDVPDLPAHIPGMIPLRLVVNGYLDDLKKAHADLKSERVDATAIVAKAEKTVSRWKQNGAEWEETAVLMVHSDRVYIIRTTGPLASAAKTLQASTEMLSTLQWTSK